MRFNATRVTVFLLACMSLAFGRMAQAADPNKVLRVATYDIETLDPQQYNDDPSFQIIMAIFEPLYEWDYLAASPRLSAVTAAGPIEVTDGGKTWTMRVKPESFSPTIRRSKASRASWSPPTTYIRTSGGSIPICTAAGRRFSPT